MGAVVEPCYEFWIPAASPNPFSIVVVVAGKDVGDFVAESEIMDFLGKERGEDLIAIERGSNRG